MEPEEKKTNYAGLVLGVFVALLLYVLSIGPMVQVAYKFVGGKGIEAFVIVYAPVLWLKQNTSFRGPLEAYVALWDNWIR